jgi:hypothetical protein
VPILYHSCFSRNATGAHFLLLRRHFPVSAFKHLLSLKFTSTWYHTRYMAAKSILQFQSLICSRDFLLTIQNSTTSRNKSLCPPAFSQICRWTHCRAPVLRLFAQLRPPTLYYLTCSIRLCCISLHYTRRAAYLVLTDLGILVLYSLT